MNTQFDTFMTSPRLSHYKIIVSGHIVEAFQYARPVGYALESSRKQSPYRARRPIDKQEVTASSISRTRNRLTRLINANARMWFCGEKVIEPVFITYTFADNVQDLTTANHIFTNYIKRLNYWIYGTKESVAKYVVVPEFQKRGAVHYHAVFFNLPSFNFQAEFKTGAFAAIWSQGFVKPKPIDHIPNVGLYMTKYLTKDSVDRRLVGRKKYFSTRGLHKPEILSHEHIAGRMMDYLTDMKPIHAYITQPNDSNPYPPENPTFCATYNLTNEQLREIKSFYTVHSI